jgi:hypothetical protein
MDKLKKLVEKAFNDDNQDIICPFCGERDFDKAGLKFHLQNHCEEYDKVILIKRKF